MASLHVLRGASVDSLFPLGVRRETVIGRDPACDVVFRDRTISRRHARIVQRDGRFFIEDLQSINGVEVNGRRIAGRAPLAHQDQIALHHVVLQFLAPEAPRESADEDSSPDDESTHNGTKGAGPDVLDFQLEDQSTIVTELDARSVVVQGMRDNAVVKLEAILEITQSLGSSLQLSDVLPRILDSLFRIFPQANRGYILQREKSTGNLELRAIKHEPSGADTVSPIGGQVAQRVMREGVAFLSGDTQTDERIAEMAATALDDSGPIRSVMCAPLMGPAQKPLGVIHVETDNPRRPFRQADLEVLVSVALLAGQAVEYTEIHEELLELDRRNLELEVARDLQLAFLPQRAPRMLAYQFAHHYRAAQYVAGDYFEYVELPNGRVAVVVGDVAGHGVSAALTMARLCSDIRYALLTTETPAEAVSKLNWQLSVQFPDLPFITQALCVLDDRDNTLTVVNAGHPYPLLRRAESKKVIQLDQNSGLPLGVHEAMAYEQFTVALEPGDLVLLYTDGVCEAMNRKGDIYTVARLSQAALKAGAEPKHVIRAVLNDVRNFAEGQPFHDDVCLVSLVRRRSG
jgi:serine phosphatase RsbU (regulator of sigma subunit)/pSer/pThr/pTyr-binding forkhead associated (FHA) protein